MIKKIKIGALWYSVKLVSPNDINGDAGETDTVKQEIKINKDLKTDNRTLCLLHEILHTVNITMEEKEIEFLAQTLGSVLIENDLLKRDKLK